MAKLEQKRCLIFVNDFLPVSPMFIDHGRSVVYEKEKPQFVKERKYEEREKDNNTTGLSRIFQLVPMV